MITTPNMINRIKMVFRFILIIAIPIAIFSFRHFEEKKYKFEFTSQQLDAVWNCIENSTQPHNQVEAVKAIIQAQLKPQLDTIPKPKPK